MVDMFFAKEDNPLHETQHAGYQRRHLGYEIVMLVLVALNLLMLLADDLLMSGLAGSVAPFIHVEAFLNRYRLADHLTVQKIAEGFTIFFVFEVAIRWLVVMVKPPQKLTGERLYAHWLLFPVFHWYEILGCIPSLRILRLIPIGLIGYRLHKLGHSVIPQKWLTKGKFYYEVVLEEVSDRIVIKILEGVRDELQGQQAHDNIVQSLLDKHRIAIAQAISEVLQHALTPALLANQTELASAIGDTVARTLKAMPELHQTARLVPVVGAKIEQQILGLAEQLGQRLTHELLTPLTAIPIAPQVANPVLLQIGQEISRVRVDTPLLSELSRTLIFEGIDLIIAQVKIQQWKSNPNAPKNP